MVSDQARSWGGLVAGIDASRNRSGGAVAHIRGLIEAGNPEEHGIRKVHLWAYDTLLDSIATRSWLSCHRVVETRAPIHRQLWWQYARLPVLARAVGVDVMFNSDAGSVCPFPVAATLSQDMLSFEQGEITRYPVASRARLRLELLKWVQLRCLSRSRLAIFLTEYARAVVGQYCQLPRTAIIPHGIDTSLRATSLMRRPWPADGLPLRCLYVSNVAPYKHQWHVVEAVARLRRAVKRDIRLRLVGGGSGPSLVRLQAAINRFDPDGQFVEFFDFVPHDMIPGELVAADLFLFASSCENLPITLLEAMASGIPICSSDRGPMREVLGPEAAYFDPEDPASIESAIRLMIDDTRCRESLVALSLERSVKYTWETCADLTWAALASIAHGSQS